jgi:ABC-2 type transport system permease protein
MSSIWALTRVELRLFLREPLTVLFALALPLLILFVLGGVFGNTPDTSSLRVFRGVGAMDFYVPAYVGLVAASVGLISVPSWLAGNRERGVLRRFQASLVPPWAVFGSQVVVALAVGAASGLVLMLAAAVTSGTGWPDDPGLFLLAFVLGAVMFAALGLMLGSLLPNARAAQAAGLLLWFAMLFLAGAGPPPEVLTDTMSAVSQALPLTHVVVLLQDAWLGFGWNWWRAALVGAWLLVATAVSVTAFRWE